MDLKIIFVYCLCDDALNLLNIKNDKQCQMSTVEIMTTGIVAALFHGGNVQAARQFLKFCNYILIIVETYPIFCLASPQFNPGP